MYHTWLLPVPATQACKSLGVTIDSSLSLENHISNVCKVCYFYIRWIRGIRPYISIEQTKSLVQTLVICRIDYCNSLFAGLSNALLARLERVMKVSARLIFKQPPRTPTHHMMKSLHWLKVKDRIRYKVLLMTWKCVNDQAPSYLNDLLVPDKPGRALRSTDATRHGDELLRHCQHGAVLRPGD